MRAQVCIAGLLLAFVLRQDVPPVSAHSLGAETGRKSPLSQIELRTTDGAIALGNLEAQIDGEEHLGTRGALTVAQRAGIAELIALRGQFLGRVADYERADAIAEELVRDAPQDPKAFLARAGARATFHRFAEALADLDCVEQLGFHGARVATQRAAILQATGHYEQALVIRHQAAQVQPDIRTLAAEASVLADHGEADAAEALFVEAPLHYRDVSPFPLAWLYFQQGLMWMREGRLERARTFFQAAHERLPAYAAAQGHLAEVEALLGNRAGAIALLRPLAECADDPDYAAQLARILGEAGQPDDARRWRDRAASRYDELMARHPAAFADHAAEFWLAAGANPQKALQCAEWNLDLRKTPRAYELVLQAALAVGAVPTACATAQQAQAVTHPWPSLRALLARTAAACSQT